MVCGTPSAPETHEDGVKPIAASSQEEPRRSARMKSKTEKLRDNVTNAYEKEAKRTNAASMEDVVRKVLSTMATMQEEMEAMKKREARSQKEMKELRQAFDDETKLVKEELRATKTEMQRMKEETEKAREKEVVTAKPPGSRTFAGALGASPAGARVALGASPAGARVSANATDGTTAGYAKPPTYITLDTAGVGDKDKSKAEVGVIRHVLERSMRTKKGEEKWKCVAATGTPDTQTASKLSRGTKRRRKR